MIKIVDLNKKYCEEIKKLKERNVELKKTLPKERNQGWRSEGVSDRGS